MRVDLELPLCDERRPPPRHFHARFEPDQAGDLRGSKKQHDGDGSHDAFRSSGSTHAGKNPVWDPAEVEG